MERDGKHTFQFSIPFVFRLALNRVSDKNHGFLMKCGLHRHIVGHLVLFHNEVLPNSAFAPHPREHYRKSKRHSPRGKAALSFASTIERREKKEGVALLEPLQGR